jgi:hypothetical protein
MFKLYSVSVFRGSGVPFDSATVDKLIAPLGDWVRFNHFQWFVWSDKRKADISLAVKPALVIGDQVIIVAVQPEIAGGFAPQWIWNWLNDKMNKQISES